MLSTASDTDVTKLKKSVLGPYLFQKSFKKWECQKRVTTTSTLIIHRPLVVPTEVKILEYISLQGAYVTEESVTLDLGDHFTLTIDYVPEEGVFKIQLRGELVAEYDVAQSGPELEFGSVTVTGDMEVNYAGFSLPAYNPTVPIGTSILFKCPYGELFEDNYSVLPQVRIQCQDDGQFTGEPQTWPKCVDREF